MRDMANSILQAAQNLFPSAPYASVFKKHFVQHNIVEVPHARFEIQKITLVNAGENGVLDPGETVDLTLTLRNTGNLVGRAIRARLSTGNPNAVIHQADAQFVDLNPGADGVNNVPFSLTLSPVAPCGVGVVFNLSLDFDGGALQTQQIVLEVQTGIAQRVGGSLNIEPPLAIPDNNQAGVSSSIWLNDNGVLAQTDAMELDIDLQHPYVADLRVSLVAPSGKEVVLHNRSMLFVEDIIGTYPVNLTPTEDFVKLLGEQLRGEWKLKVKDIASGDSGKLKKWGFRAVSGFQCVAP
jgi:subtilisin-like proprotein convertase family protein